MGKDKENRRSLHVHTRHSVISGTSGQTFYHSASRQAFTDMYAASMQAALDNRSNFKIIQMTPNMTGEDLTPPLLDDDFLVRKFADLKKKVVEEEFSMGDYPLRLAGMSLNRFTTLNKLILDDALSVKSSVLFSTTEPIDPDSDSDEEEKKKPPICPKVPPFIKIVLRKTEEIVLFEQHSKTVLRNSSEAFDVQEDNKLYDYITIGKGRMRRTATSEAQTKDKLKKSRGTCTQPINTTTNKSYVSNFLMFQTMKNNLLSLESSSSTDIRDISTVQKSEFEELVHKHQFKTALMKTLRLLAGNVFESQQRRFRNFILPPALGRERNFRYALNHLLQFNPPTSDRHRKAVADMTFCPGNGDIIAVAYGIYSFGYMHVPEDGYCCVWNIKNPINPERKYHFNSPVVSVQFSPFTPQLLAVGLYDGTVEIRDITTFSERPIAVSLHSKTATWDPVLALEWVAQTNVSGQDNFEIEPLLALSQDGSVIKYRIISSPYLLAFQQMQLDRTVGSPEGLPFKRNWNKPQSSRFPQGLNIKRHPNQNDIYYILTDDGCILKCSTNYPHQHINVLQAHIGSVNEMDFSPWSPKLFLTCGNDWCIRIWMEDILEPLITLKHKAGPIHCAAWSKTHSTVIISNSRSDVHIWDIRRCILKPVNSANVTTAILTMFKFSRCGRSIAVGTVVGSVLILGLDDMPIPPHFQYDELELAIYKAIATKVNLTNEVKSMGFFGYPEQNHLPNKLIQCAYT